MLDSVPVTAPFSATAPIQEPSDGRVRVFGTDSQSSETRGSSAAGGNSNGWASSSFSGGARPQTAGIIKTFSQRCPELTVTNNLGKADLAASATSILYFPYSLRRSGSVSLVLADGDFAGKGANPCSAIDSQSMIDDYHCVTMDVVRIQTNSLPKRG